MNTIAPNMARPITKPIALATRKTLEPNSDSGMIGSAARRSCQMKAASRATPAAARPRMAGEPQAYSFPPHVVRRMIALTPAVSSSAPSQSIVWRCAGVRRCSRKITTSTATAPIGMFT